MPVNQEQALVVNYTVALGHLLFFIGGTLITLLISIFDVTRRTAIKLFAGCVFGGAGAVLAGMATASWGGAWPYGCAGIAAVMTENILMGFFRASKQFSENPFPTIGQFIKDVLPSIPGLGKKAD